MPDYLEISGRVRTIAYDGVVVEAQEVKDLLKNKSQQELNNDFSTAIEAILLLIPSAASSLNKLADKAFVNSSIATASATFRGTYNLVSDLNLTVSATHAQIGAALAGAISDEDNNDYAFVQVPTSDETPTQIAKTERYKFNGTEWEYEYDLNNSGYTADQWAAINSGINAALVTKLSALPTNADLTTALGVLTDGIAAINAKIPSAASSSNKLVDTAAMQSYITQVLDTIDATFNVTSTDGHVTVQITQVNGVITAVNVTTSNIASDADLSLLAGRVTTAEGNISTNAQDIANLQQLYNNLQQSAPVVIEPTDTWPVAVADRSATVIYRVVDRVNTTPQYYSDYLFRASDLSGQPVLMAQYDNAIDPRPKKGSQNLVTSGGVFDNIGALDVSELNATENPHTLATYADLSAALAAIPSDYRKGGITIKFVLSSDNKYVQARCMAQNFSTDPNDWQGVDNIPTAGSNNLVKSGGVYPSKQYLDRIHCICYDLVDTSGIDGEGNPTIGSSYFYRTGCIEILDATKIKNVSPSNLSFAYYNSNIPSSTSFIETNNTGIVPEGATYFLIIWYEPGHVLPSSITYEVEGLEDRVENTETQIDKINGEIDYLENVIKGVTIIKKSDIVQKSVINESGEIVSTGVVFYRTSAFAIVAGNKIIGCDNSKMISYSFYSSDTTIGTSTFVGSNNTGLIPDNAKYCIISFYDRNNNDQGDAIPLVTTVSFSDGITSKTCIYIGDSISTGDTYFWKGYLETYYNMKYVRNASQGGSSHESETDDSVLWPADGGITLIPPVTESTYNDHKSIWYRCAENRMSIYDFDVISLCGGTNDMSPNITTLGTKEDTPYLDTTASRPATLTFAAALMGCIEMLHRDFPTKPILLCTVFACGLQGNQEDENGVTFSERMALLQMEIADKYALAGYNITAVPFYWDMRNKLTARAGVFSKDTVHPNRAWAKRMMNVFAQSVPLKQI